MAGLTIIAQFTLFACLQCRNMYTYSNSFESLAMSVLQCISIYVVMISCRVPCHHELNGFTHNDALTGHSLHALGTTHPVTN